MCVCDEMKQKIHQMSCYSPPSVSLSGWSVPVLLCPESSRLWEKPADVNAPIPPLDHWPAESFEDAVWVTGRRRTAWNVLFALRLRHWLWRWCFSSSSSFFFLSFNSCHPALSSSHRPTPSPHPLRRAKCCTGRYEHHHPCTPTQTHPPSVSLTTFVFTETLMAVFKTHCDV